MRDTPAGIVEELREIARFEAFELGEDVRETTAADSADYIERLTAALQQIRDGAPDPVSIAHAALDLADWLRG